MTERERQTPYDITYRWNLKYDTNELIYETQTHRYRDIVAKEGVGERSTGREGLAVWD